jgi:hypothetical protein
VKRYSNDALFEYGIHVVLALRQLADERAERIAQLETMLWNRPMPDCPPAEMIAWYLRIDAALGVQPVLDTK